MLPTTPNTHARKALVTDGLWRKSLSAVRSLGKSGFHVTVMGETAFTTGFWSRYTRRRIKSPTAATDADQFGQALLKALEENPGTVLLPMEDLTLKWVMAHLEQVSRHARFLLPTPEAFQVAMDKGQTLAAAQSLGIPCPKTIEPKGRVDFLDNLSQLEDEDFAVKPRSGTGSAGVAYNGTWDRDGWEKHWESFGPLLIQERIPAEGRGQGVSLLMDQDGECVAVFAHERLKQYPLSGGPSTDRQSIHAPELVQMSIALLEKLNWRGIAMVEWKLDPRDGKPKLMEINPRFWGSLELAVRAGIDFPTLYARASLGEKLGPPATYPAHVRCRWVIPGEILRYWNQPKQERESLRDFLRGLPKLAEEWDPKDLLGGIATFVCTFVLALNPRYWKYVRRG